MLYAVCENSEHDFPSHGESHSQRKCASLMDRPPCSAHVPLPLQSLGHFDLHSSPSSLSEFTQTNPREQSNLHESFLVVSRRNVSRFVDDAAKASWLDLLPTRCFFETLLLFFKLLLCPISARLSECAVLCERFCAMFVLPDKGREQSLPL